MPFTLDQVMPWGRSSREYIRMFSLTDADLEKKILGCGDGPASFNAAMRRQGKKVVSVDPLYAFSADQIRGRVQEASKTILEQLVANQSAYVWTMIRSPQELAEIRMKVMEVSAAAGLRTDVAARTQPADCLSGGWWESRGCEPRYRDTETLAEVFGCGMDGEVLNRYPQVKLAPGRMALEATVTIRCQIDPEVAALGIIGLMDRARAAKRTAVATTGDEAQESQDLFDRDLRS